MGSQACRQIARVLAAAMIGSCQAHAEPASSPVAEHHVNAKSRIVDTKFACADGERLFSVRYEDNSATVSFVSGTRKGKAVPLSDAKRITQGLSKLDSVSYIYPQCGTSSDLLLAIGRSGRRQAFVAIVWSNEQIEVSTPQMTQ